MKYTVSIILIIFLLVLIITKSDNKHSEKRIELTQHEFISLYQNGYLKGEFNGLKFNSKIESTMHLRKDSAEIIKVFFK